MNVTGNPHVAVTAGFGGAATLDFVADPLWVAGGAGKVFQTGKAAIKGVSGASAIARVATSGAGFTEISAAAAKNGSGLIDRGASVASKAQTAAKQGSVLAERGVVATTEKPLAKDMSPRVKNGEGGLSPRTTQGVDASKADQKIQKTFADRTVRPVESRASLADELAQQPLDPFAARRDLEAVYGAKNVKTATLPAENAPGVKYRGGKNPKSDVPYDMRGNPTFDYKPGNVLYQTELKPTEFMGKNRDAHLRASTRQLGRDIESGIIQRHLFTEEQLKAIMGGKAKIPDYTWHHDQQLGRMILVDEEVHKLLWHTGAIGQMKNANK